MNFLIVDDSKTSRNININMIREVRTGDVFYEATNGKEALDIMKFKRVDLVVLDWNMPELDGLQFVQIVRNMEKYKELPIIMVTSNASKHDVTAAIKAGITNYVVKPVLGMSLWEKIKPFCK